MHIADLDLRDETLDFQRVAFDYRRHPDQDTAPGARHPVIVVGAGPVGLALAIDLAQRGVPVVLLDNDHRLSTGSRAICFAKRTLEIFDRLGCGDQMVDKGVSWNIGRVFLRDEPVYRFDLQPEDGHERPAFINLQQYYVEGYLTARAGQLPLIDLRWQHAVSGLEQHGDHAWLTVETPEGPYRVAADHVIACDGSRSALRQLVGQESHGRTFRDRFLIADVRMDYDGPAERWFWFDPPFHPGQSVLLHRQPDGVWRIDFQLGWDADPDEEKKPENILPRVRALLAHSAMKDCPFELEWASVYTFSCLRMDSFRHGRVFFAGDSAHGVSPFGARGANSGVQDAENLAWKLAAVVRGQAPVALLDSYGSEREYAADENIRHSTRATDFITPKSPVSRLFRDAVLELAKTQAFARTLVNSGRLSTPAVLHGSTLGTPDADAFDGDMVPGASVVDAPLRHADGTPSWLLRELGPGFSLLVSGRVDPALSQALGSMATTIGLRIIEISTGRPDGTSAAPATGGSAIATLGQAGTEGALEGAQQGGQWLSGPERLRLWDESGHLGRRFDLRSGSVYLIRPDQHVCARWRQAAVPAVLAALDRCLARA